MYLQRNIFNILLEIITNDICNRFQQQQQNFFKRVQAFTPGNSFKNIYFLIEISYNYICYLISFAIETIVAYRLIKHNFYITYFNVT